MVELDMQKQKGLKVCFFHLSTGAISWYRMVQYANHMSHMEDMFPYFPAFHAEEADKKWRDYEQDPEKRLPDLEALFEVADLAVVGTVHSMKFWTTLCALRDWFRVPLITECDDHPFDIDPNHDHYRFIGAGSEIEKNTYDQVKESNWVITSTEYLAEVLRGYNKNVSVIPNSIDQKIWEPLKKPENASDEVVLGWAGASNHFKDLSLVRKPFEILLEKYPNLKIKCLHGAVEFMNHPRFFNDPDWVNIFEYPQKLCDVGLDIAVAPLWDSEFNRAKSNLRYLEYGALGIPVVASKVRPYLDTIDDGINGYLASGTEEWVDKLSKLIDSKAERDRIGKAAYRHVAMNYNSQNVARSYADLLKKIFLDVRVPDVHVRPTAG